MKIKKTKRAQKKGKENNVGKKTVHNKDCYDCVNYQNNVPRRINDGFNIGAQDGNSNSDY